MLDVSLPPPERVYEEARSEMLKLALEEETADAVDEPSGAAASGDGSGPTGGRS